MSVPGRVGDVCISRTGGAAAAGGAVRGAGGCGGVLGASECCSAEERFGASGGGARDCAPPGHAADLVHESSTASDTLKDASTSTSPDR